jgi:hypothetical protein
VAGRTRRRSANVALLVRVAPVLLAVGLLSLTAVVARLPVDARGARAQPLADPAPRTALGRPRLFPIAKRVKRQCRLAQARAPAPLLCPRRLPHAWLRPWRTPRGTPPPALTVQRADYLDRGGRSVLLTFGYGAPWEPDSGQGWRQHLWRNGPCCFLHFELIARVRGRALALAGGRRVSLGGQRGVYLPARGYAPQCGQGDSSGFWCNHAVFAWRQRGLQYAATLHFFGARATRDLLARLVGELAPVH